MYETELSRRAAMFSYIVLAVCTFYSFLFSVSLVRWLGGSFAFFSLALRVEKNANVPPTALKSIVNSINS